MNSSLIPQSSNYSYLFLKEQQSILNSHRDKLREIIEKHIPEEISIEISKYPAENQKAILYGLMEVIMKEEWAKKSMEKITANMVTRAKELYEFDTQRNYFLVENFRESCSEPICVSRSPHIPNLESLYSVGINKELRRTIWLKSLFLEENKSKFFVIDHQICPYNLTEEMSIGLVRLCQENNIRIKENQKDCALRLLEFIVKKWNRLPNRSEQYLVMTIIDVFAHYTPSKIHELGSVFVGLLELTEVYFEENLEQRLEYINLGFRLVDDETCTLIKEFYLPNSTKEQGELNECFEHFRLTLCSAYLPMAGSQFVIDQLLIKRRNKLDMYIIFAIMNMIMSDELERCKEGKNKLTDVIYAENTKKQIKLEDVYDAWKVIYENVGHFHGEEVRKGNNQLLNKLREFDEEQENEVKDKIGGNLKDGKFKEWEVPEGFIVEDKSNVLRLGEKKK